MLRIGGELSETSCLAIALSILLIGLYYLSHLDGLWNFAAGPAFIPSSLLKKFISADAKGESFKGPWNTAVCLQSQSPTRRIHLPYLLSYSAMDLISTIMIGPGQEACSGHDDWRISISSICGGTDSEDNGDEAPPQTNGHASEPNPGCIIAWNLVHYQCVDGRKASWTPWIDSLNTQFLDNPLFLSRPIFVFLFFPCLNFL